MTSVAYATQIQCDSSVLHSFYFSLGFLCFTRSVKLSFLFNLFLSLYTVLTELCFIKCAPIAYLLEATTTFICQNLFQYCLKMREKKNKNNHTIRMLFIIVVVMHGTFYDSGSTRTVDEKCNVGLFIRVHFISIYLIRDYRLTKLKCSKSMRKTNK